MTKLYKQSGVNIEKSDELTLRISKNSTNIGRFGAICEHEFLKDYYLVTTTDGIGSKIIPLMQKGLYATVAADLIAMNLNDLACSGAVPVSFVDYISVNKLDSEPIAQVISELKKQLKKYGCELCGGETSELKNIIQPEKIDIAGFATGLVKKENLLDKKNVEKDDVIIGLCSSGIHSNGFSLITYLYENEKLTQEEYKQCLEPTIIYINEIIELCELKLITSAANITGGGIVQNLKRSVGNDLELDLNFSAILEQPIFKKLFELCGEEAYEVFNMGVGFCVITKEKNVEKVLEHLKKYKPFVFGKVV